MTYVFDNAVKCSMLTAIIAKAKRIHTAHCCSCVTLPQPPPFTVHHVAMVRASGWIPGLILRPPAKKDQPPQICLPFRPRTYDISPSPSSRICRHLSSSRTQTAANHFSDTRASQTAGLRIAPLRLARNSRQPHTSLSRCPDRRALDIKQTTT